MITEKQRILNGIDKDADQNTHDVANQLTEKEAGKISRSIESHLNRIDGVTPMTSILELKRTGNSINYKLKLETQIWQGLDLA